MLPLQGKPGEPVRMKDEKELKPASIRVRDTAEAVLTIVLEQVSVWHMLWEELKVVVKMWPAFL